MKIAQINTVCGNGSVGRITVDIYHALEKKGHEGKIYYGRRTAPEGIRAERFGSDMELGQHVLSTFLTGHHGFASKGQTKKLIAALKAYDPDLIHLHNVHGFYVNIELLFEFLKSFGKPVVWTLHDCWSFTGHCAYFDLAGCEKWKRGCEHCPQYRKAYPYALLRDASRENYARKKAAFGGVKGLTIVTPSRWLAGLVKESFLKEYPVRVIPNGIDLDVFCPQNATAYPKYRILGAANVWDERKGLVFFEELWKRLEHDKYEITVAGVSDKQKKHLPEGMKAIGYTKNIRELVQLYSDADVYVNPTLEDNFPTTNLEALACGTPVVTFETGGSMEALDETCGRVVPQRDVDALEQAVRSLCEKKEFLRGSCREQALHYNKYDRFGEYLNLYEESIDHYNDL